MRGDKNTCLQRLADNCQVTSGKTHCKPTGLQDLSNLIFLISQLIFCCKQATILYHLPPKKIAGKTLKHVELCVGNMLGSVGQLTIKS